MEKIDSRKRAHIHTPKTHTHTSTHTYTHIHSKKLSNNFPFHLLQKPEIYVECLSMAIYQISLYLLKRLFINAPKIWLYKHLYIQRGHEWVPIVSFYFVFTGSESNCVVFVMKTKKNRRNKHFWYYWCDVGRAKHIESK